MSAFTTANNFKTKTFPFTMTSFMELTLAFSTDEIYNIVGYFRSSSLNLEDSLSFSAISTRRDMSELYVSLKKPVLLSL
jgi:hypothetical protein